MKRWRSLVGVFLFPIFLVACKTQAREEGNLWEIVYCPRPQANIVSRAETLTTNDTERDVRRKIPVNPEEDFLPPFSGAREGIYEKRAIWVWEEDDSTRYSLSVDITDGTVSDVWLSGEGGCTRKLIF